MKKNVGLVTVVGFLAFVALMASGLVWILGLVDITGGVIALIGSIANLILAVIAGYCGWVWLVSTKMNHTLKIVLEVLFIVFAILAILGGFGIKF